MPTYTFKRESVCSDNNHHHISITDDTIVRNVHTDTDFLRSPVTEDELEIALKVILRAGLKGLTLGQAAAKLMSGFTMVIN